MKRYVYSGPVYIFDECINDHWEAETMAVSEKKAKSNFMYQYKRKKGLSNDATVRLKGVIKEED